MVAKPSHMHVGEGAESIHQPRPRAGPPPCCQAKLLNIVSTFRFRTNWLRFLYYLIMISLGSLVKSLTGTGIFLVMYSHTTSMLYLSWAKMGMMGAPSATVPSINLGSARAAPWPPPPWSDRSYSGGWGCASAGPGPPSRAASPCPHSYKSYMCHCDLTGRKKLILTGM